MKVVLTMFALMLLPGSFMQDKKPVHQSVPYFVPVDLPFQLEAGETPAKNLPEAMPGGVAVFDFNGDGRPDLFFTNGANIATLKKDDPKYKNKLLRNDGDGHFTDVTEQSGLGEGGFDIGVAAADYDNDGHPDLFVAGVYGNHLFHNNGNGTFSDVTSRAGLGRSIDPEYGPLWSVGAVWVDVNNDGLLDLFVVNYVQWKYSSTPLCGELGNASYCHPRYFKGLPNQLFLNQGDGTFKDVSAEWGIRSHIGKGMAAMIADYDRDGRQDIFVTNDASYNFMFHNKSTKFDEVAFETNVALAGGGIYLRNGWGLPGYRQRWVARYRLCCFAKSDISPTEEHRKGGFRRDHNIKWIKLRIHTHGWLWWGFL